jgi:2-dehydro-3-deoxygluconokinase
MTTLEISPAARLVCFGEVLLRLCPPGHDRLAQALPGGLEATFAGAEVNTAVMYAALGGAAELVTALPDNTLGRACEAELRRHRLITGAIRRSVEGRLGTYYVEHGTDQRPSVVLYDRDNSAMARFDPAAYDWTGILHNAGRLHLSGITPALSSAAAEAVLAAAKAAAKLGVPVSLDFNFRGKLWRWEPGTPPAALARRLMGELLERTALVLISEMDIIDILGLEVLGAGECQGDDRSAVMLRAARALLQRFPRIRHVAMTRRHEISTSQCNWSAMLYEANSHIAYFAPQVGEGCVPYEIRSIVDRLGTGDAFAGALLFALDEPNLKHPQAALEFATAAACLAHSIRGDFAMLSRAEVEYLVHHRTAGKIQR